MAEEVRSGVHSPARKLQRIKSAEDRDKEIDYQIKAAKAKLEASGVATEDLDIR